MWSYRSDERHRSRKQRVTGVLLGGVLSGLLLAACGGGSDGAADPTTTGSAPQATTTTAAPTTTQAPTTTLAPTTTQAPTTTVATTTPGADLVAQGELIFQETAGGIGCQACHGKDARGGVGPNIIGKSAEVIQGNLDTNPNMTFIILTPQEVEAVAAYLATLPS